MCFISAKVQPHNLYDKSKPTFDKQLLSNHILFENQSPNLFGDPPPSAISSALFTKNPRHLIRTPEILSLVPLPATKTSFSINQPMNICFHFKSLLRGYLTSSLRCRSLRPSLSSATRKNHLRTPLSKACFVAENQVVFMSRKCTSKMQMAAVCALGY